MKIIVTTNNDKDIHIDFPKEVCCKPEIGDRIQSINTLHERKICRIVHCIDYDNTPYLTIEVTR